MGILFRADQDPTTLPQVIRQGVGAASVCWESMEGTGIFDEARANLISEEIIDWVDKHYDKPNLGLASTGELIDELRARAALGGYLEYRTVDGG